MGKNRTSFTSDTAPKGGRPPGAKGKTTQELRDMIQVVMEKNMERLETDLNAMSPTNRWLILQKLAAYFMPTLSKNDNTNVNSGEIVIRVDYGDGEPIQPKLEEQKAPQIDVQSIPIYLANQEPDWMKEPEKKSVQ